MNNSFEIKNKKFPFVSIMIDPRIEFDGLDVSKPMPLEVEEKLLSKILTKRGNHPVAIVNLRGRVEKELTDVFLSHFVFSCIQHKLFLDTINIEFYNQKHICFNLHSYLGNVNKVPKYLGLSKEELNKLGYSFPY